MYEMDARNRMIEIQQMVETLGIVAGAALRLGRVTEERVAAVTVERQELVAARVTIVRVPIWSMTNSPSLS